MMETTVYTKERIALLEKKLEVCVLSVHVCMHVYVHVCVCVCMRVYVHVCVCVCVVVGIMTL